MTKTPRIRRHLSSTPPSLGWKLRSDGVGFFFSSLIYRKFSFELKAPCVLFCSVQLSEALQVSTQATAEINLQKKLREDAQLRVEELEESLLEKDQELQRHQVLVSRLQGEVLKLTHTVMD